MRGRSRSQRVVSGMNISPAIKTSAASQQPLINKWDKTSAKLMMKHFIDVFLHLFVQYCGSNLAFSLCNLDFNYNMS